MGGFFYFFPKLCGLPALQAAGLGYAFATAPAMTEVGPAAGPEGQAGMVFHAGTVPTLPALSWHDSALGWWVGHSPADRPTERSLRTGAVMCMAGEVTLADGAAWQVPMIAPCTRLDPNRTTGLPLVFSAGENELDPRKPYPSFLAKQAVLRVARQYQPLYEWAVRLKAIAMERPAEFPQAETLAYCAAVLGVGYRVGPAELLALELLTPQAATQILRITADCDEEARAEMDAATRMTYDGVVAGGRG